MRVVVTGATGNVGSSVLTALVAEPQVDEIVGIARRVAGVRVPKTTFVSADVGGDDLAGPLAGADVVVHTAWLLRPSRQRERLHRANVVGTRRVVEAALAAGVGRVVVASSVGAYSLGPKDRPVDESWPTDGIPTSLYSRQKAAVESYLDGVERDHPGLALVRMRKGLVLKRAAASEIAHLFLGPLVPRRLIRPALVPIVPDVERLVAQVVHSDDAGEAYRLAVLGDAVGAFNIATEPQLDVDLLARVLDARPVKVPASVIRAAADLTYRLRLQPTDPGWVDLVLGVPLMDTQRARTELGWTPRHSADDTLAELIGGMADRAGSPEPPLQQQG